MHSSAPLYRCLHESPVGWIALLGSDLGLRRVSLQPQLQDALAGLGEDASVAEDNPDVFADVLSALNDYFAGNMSALQRIKVDLSGSSPFFSAAWGRLSLNPARRDPLLSVARRSGRESESLPGGGPGHGKKSGAAGNPVPSRRWQQREPPRVRRRGRGSQGPSPGTGTPAAIPLVVVERERSIVLRRSGLAAILGASNLLRRHTDLSIQPRRRQEVPPWQVRNSLLGFTVPR